MYESKIFKFSGYLIDTIGTSDSEALEDLLFFADCQGYKCAQHVHVTSAPLNESELDECLIKNCDLSLCEKHFRKQTSAAEYDRPIPHPGEYWKHFKVGKIVRIIAVSRCTESPDSFSVIYQDPGGTVWDRPLDMFMSEVDHEKYPQSKEKYRFSKVEG